MRKLAWFALSFSAAVLLACYWIPLGALPWLALLCGGGGGGGLCLLLGKGDQRTRGLLLTLGLAAGLLWFWGWTALFYAPGAARAGTEGALTATVLEEPEETDFGIRVEVEADCGVPVRTLLYAGTEYGGLRPGDRIAGIARFQAADYRQGENVTYYTSKGIFLVAYADGTLTVERAEPTPPRFWPVVWAGMLRDSLKRCFADAEAGSLTEAVVLGTRDGLTDSARASFSRVGLSHTVAVSGMHVSFLVSLLLFLCGRRRKLAAAVTLPALILFAFLVGCSPSVVRAVVMQILLLLAPLLGRESDGPTSLSFALLLLLLWNPYAAASISLQLSFAAVAGIFLVSGPILEKLRPCWDWKARSWPGGLVRRAAHFVCATCATTLGALLFTTPLSALYFGSVSILAPLANLLTLWAVSFLFLGGLAAGLAGLLSVGAGSLLALPVTGLARFILWVAETLGRLPFAAVTLSSLYYKLWLGAAYLLVGALLWFRREGVRPILPLCGGVVTLCAAIGLTRASVVSAPLTVAALDVGQGSATAVYVEGRTMLVDCGGSSLNNPGDVAADWFQSFGVSRLDLLVLTHFDDDHFNGVEQLFARLDVGAVAVPEITDETGRMALLEGWAEAEGAAVWKVDEQSAAELGRARLTLYPPLGQGTTNEEGLSALCSVGHYDVLITGDADSAIEAMLVKYFDLPDIELLMVGHHGSRHSTSAAFLEAVSPETAIISCGYNTYGHPADETLQRLAQAGVEVYRTDQQGTVTVTVSGEGT